MPKKILSREILSREILPQKILIVEDDPGYLALLKLRLGKAGFDVAAAEGGEAAKTVFSESPVPVVVTDLVMPKVNGLTLLNFVKEASPDTEVILLSGKGSIEQAVEAMRAGAFDFLVKPVEDGKLEALVVTCFETIERRKGGGELESEDGTEDLALQKTLAKWPITRSESRVIVRVLKGKTDQEIADDLFVSYHTVKKHLQNVFRKMEVKNRIELILLVK